MSDYLERMVTEEMQLQAKLYGLSRFLANPKPDDVLDEEWELLKEQHLHMTVYRRILEKRIELATGKETNNVIQ